MAKRVVATSLMGSTIQILNTIRANASYEYQQNVPVIEKSVDIPKVGEVIYGNPAFLNQFLNALINRIALVRVQSAVFNNPYTRLKKGYLEFGETIEEIFVNIAKVIDYNAEKGEEREFKRNLPDVRSAFHVMNWRVMYPVTIQDEDLKLAFLSADGVQNLIAKIVDSIYTAAEYDEYLLFKYLLVKAISHGKFKPISVGNGTTLTEAAYNYRGISNLLPFMKSDYNESGVLTTTPKSKQIIFMDAMYNAQYDVDVLSAAFNMDKATYMGSLFLIDDWTTFDNNRFEYIRSVSDGIEEVTSAELALLADVKAVIVDEDWFQVYDNLNKFTEKYVSSGLYWNYFYHTWKTVSNSPFANAVVFVTDSANIALPATITVEVSSKDVSDEATVFGLKVQDETATLSYDKFYFEQTEDATTKGIAIHKYGAVIFPKGQTTTTLSVIYNGTEYTPATALTTDSEVGATITFNKAGT
nr:MAG TPA: Head protein [Caudoviricetes sp.]